MTIAYRQRKSRASFRLRLDRNPSRYPGTGACMVWGPRPSHCLDFERVGQNWEDSNMNYQVDGSPQISRENRMPPPQPWPWLCRGEPLSSSCRGHPDPTYAAASGGGRGAVATPYTWLLVASPGPCGVVREGGVRKSSLKDKCALLIDAPSGACLQSGGVRIQGCRLTILTVFTGA